MSHNMILLTTMSIKGLKHGTHIYSCSNKMGH